MALLAIDPSAWAILVAAVGTVLVNIIMAMRADKKLDTANDKADAAAGKADVAAAASEEVKVMTQEIHVMVNDNLTKAQAEVAQLKEVVINLQETVAKLATAGRTADEDIIQQAITETATVQREALKDDTIEPEKEP